MSGEQAGVREVTTRVDSPEMSFSDVVSVVVTPKGEEVRQRYYQEAGTPATPLVRDAEGRSKMSLMEVAVVFGEQLYPANQQLPIQMDYRTEGKARGGTGQERSLNQEAWFKVSREGQRLSDEYFQGLKMRPEPIVRDAKGWSRMTLGRAMNLFGKHLQEEGEKLPIELTFRTEAP